MPAGIINLFFISNLLGHPGLLEMSPSKVGKKYIFAGNFHMPIMVDLLLLG